MAYRAFLLCHHVGDFVLDEFRVGLAPPALEARDDALEGMVHVGYSARSALVGIL